MGSHYESLVRGPGIVVGRKGTVGATFWSESDFWPIDTTYYVAPKSAEMRWIYWLLRNLPLGRLDTSTGVPGLNRNDVYELPAHVPPLSEQRKIAEILDTLDEAIRQTEAILAKLKQVKQGLLHDLLTRGIDENGELRDPERHPEQFKDSPLGRIPKEWEVGPLRAYAGPGRPHLKTGPFGSSLKQEHWVPNGIPVVTIGSLGEGYFLPDELLYIGEATARALAAYALRPGDIVFSRVADVGRSVVVTEQEDGWIMSSNMMWISLDRARVNASFVQANIAANNCVRDQISRFVNSAGRDVANATIMNHLQFPWCVLEEQNRIVSILRTAENRAGDEESHLAKLRLLKQGLMDDLLTGRVRVTALLAEDDS